MWSLMVGGSVDASDIHKALVDNKITCRNDLRRLAEDRFRARNAKPSKDKTLDALVMANAFCDCADDFLLYLEKLGNIQSEYNEEREEEDMEDMEDFNELFVVAEQELFGFDKESVDAAICSMFSALEEGSNPDDDMAPWDEFEQAMDGVHEVEF